MTKRERIAELPTARLLAELSLWSADLCNLARDVGRTEPFADLYHIDVADGRFAPSFLFFADQVARIRELTRRPLHVHLMVEGDILLEQIQQFAAAGADVITVHVENGPALVAEALSLIDNLGCASGIVLCLETSVTELAPYLDRVAFATLLGTAIGVKGQGLSETACPRLVTAAAMLREAGREQLVRLAAAGAQSVVLGSLAFGDPDLASRIEWLHGLQAE